MGKLRIKDSNKLMEIENVYCIGKNYLDHIKEIDKTGQDYQLPQEPIIFLKPNTSVVPEQKKVSIPRFKGKYISEDLQNEIELVVVIGRDGTAIPIEDAISYVFGYAVGIDFTLRDIQTEMKKKGLPWTLSKGFLTSAPVSRVIPKKYIRDPQSLSMSLTVNGEIKQQDNTSKMIFKLDYIIHYISTIFGLRKGDLIFTGTPAGVTKLSPGDVVKAEIEKVGELNVIFK